MLRVRGGSGLGDSLYLRPVAEHFVRAGGKVVVLSDYVDVFRGAGCVVEPFRRHSVDVVAHYISGKNDPSTTLWQDLCKSAGVAVPLNFAWTVQNRKLVDDLKAKAEGDPIIVVHGGREPMGRRDGFGLELLPDRRAFETVLGMFADCFTVRVGKGDQIYSLPADVDLNGNTSVSDLLDIAFVCDGIVAQCSFCVPLAEVFDKPLLVIWAARGLASAVPFIKTVTPGKILSKASSRYVIDDQSTDCIQEAVRAAFRYSLMEENRIIETRG